MEAGQDINIPDVIVHFTTGEMYKKGRFLGKGYFAKCYEITNIQDKTVYAAKIISQTHTTYSKSVPNEVSLHAKLHHENITKLYGFFEDYNFGYLLMEVCNRGSMKEMIKPRKYLTEIEVRYYMKQVFTGIAYLHRELIIHRDLKLGNLLLTEDFHVKISDFGSAVQSSKGAKHFGLCGTPNYIAPEVVTDTGHSFEFDIFSTGCIMYTLLFGTPPFEDLTREKVFERVKRCIYYIPSDEETSQAAIELVKSLLQVNPKDRPSAPHSLSTEFMKGFVPGVMPLSSLTEPPTFDEVQQDTKIKYRYNLRKPLHDVNRKKTSPSGNIRLEKEMNKQISLVQKGHFPGETVIEDDTSRKRLNQSDNELINAGKLDISSYNRNEKLHNTIHVNTTDKSTLMTGTSNQTPNRNNNDPLARHAHRIAVSNQNVAKQSHKPCSLPANVPVEKKSCSNKHKVPQTINMNNTILSSKIIHTSTVCSEMQNENISDSHSSKMSLQKWGLLDNSDITKNISCEIVKEESASHSKHIPHSKHGSHKITKEFVPYNNHNIDKPSQNQHNTCVQLNDRDQFKLYESKIPKASTSNIHGHLQETKDLHGSQRSDTVNIYNSQYRYIANVNRTPPYTQNYEKLYTNHDSNNTISSKIKACNNINTRTKIHTVTYTGTHDLLSYVHNCLQKILNFKPVEKKQIQYNNDSALRMFVRVLSWYDCTSKYGFAYQLSNTSVGVMFNDGTDILLLPDGTTFRFLSERKVCCCKISHYPNSLKRKVKIVLGLKKRLQTWTQKYGNIVNVSDFKTGHNPYVADWHRSDTMIMILLTNGTLQLEFFHDNTTLIFCFGLSVIIFISADKQLQTIYDSSILQTECSPEMVMTLKYALDAINKVKSSNESNCSTDNQTLPTKKRRMWNIN